jgi:hypothetical protein
LGLGVLGIVNSLLFVTSVALEADDTAVPDAGAAAPVDLFRSVLFKVLFAVSEPFIDFCESVKSHYFKLKI